MGHLFDKLQRQLGAPAPTAPNPERVGGEPAKRPLAEKLRVSLFSNAPAPPQSVSLFKPQAPTPAPKAVEEVSSAPKPSFFDPPKRDNPRPAEVDPDRSFTGMVQFRRRGEDGEEETRDRSRGVQKCPEFLRVQALPMRELDMNLDLTEEFRKPGGTMQLWPIQSQVIYDARIANGGLAPVGVGFGKTLCSLLLTEALQSNRTVLLVPSQLRDQLLNVDIPMLYQHFNIALSKIHVVAYETLSSAKNADILDRLQPDLIVADEAHKLRHRTSARTKRFLRYFKAHPGTRLVALSGTLTTRSLRDYGHLSELALRKGSPLPHWERFYSSLTEWSEAIDVPKRDESARPPGILVELCSAEERVNVALAKTSGTATDVVRAAFRRRLVSTRGVVATSENELGTSLILARRPVVVPENITKELRKLYTAWAIGEEEFEDATALWRVARQLACGFYYRWAWPNNEPDREWLEARRNWHAEVREFLQRRARAGIDSPYLYQRAVESGKQRSDAWPAWKAVMDRPVPPTVPVWLSDFVVLDAIKFAAEAAKEKEPCVIWYEHAALGEAIARGGKFPLCGPGEDASERLRRAADGKQTVVASIRAHGTGKNLQAYARALVTTPMSSGTAWEQLLGRHHRPGQQADEVRFEFYMHSEEYKNAWLQAQEDAKYQEQTTGSRQKLLYATKIV